MKNIFIRSLFVALFVSLLSANIVLAHGGATITVEPAVASPGDKITIVGADMEDGEVFKITLENGAGTLQLGEATSVKKGDEAGFTAVFALPNNLTDGFYLVRATTSEDETIAADLTIAANQASTLAMEASAAQHTLDRSQPPLLTGSIVVLALLSAGLSVWLVRMRE